MAKILLDDILFITAADHEIVNAVMAVGFHDMPEDGFLPPISTIGLGIRLVASLRRVPKPPAKMTAFIMLDRLLKVNNRKLLMGRDKVTDRTDHVVEHGTGHARMRHRSRGYDS